MKHILGFKPLFAIAVILALSLLILVTWGLSVLQKWEMPSLFGLSATAVISESPFPVHEDASSTSASNTATPISADGVPIYQFIEITDSCDWQYVGTCVNMRSGPGENYPSVIKLRTGMVLKVSGSVESNGRTWYKITYDEGLRYPERVAGDEYVASDFVRLFTDEGQQTLPSIITIMGTKRIEVDITKEMLYAYDGDTLFMQEPISTGLDLTPTPLGTFIIYKKTPSRYMQGPIVGVSDQYYDLPGVPWDLYFSYGGAVIHGAYWHNHFGEAWSHGCVNLPPQKAKELYYWADIGTSVTVHL